MLYEPSFPHHDITFRDDAIVEDLRVDAATSWWSSAALRPGSPSADQCRIALAGAVDAGSAGHGIVKLRLMAAFGARHGGFATGWRPVFWGSLDELFINLTMPQQS